MAFFADYDVLVTPALAERPLPIGECNGLGENPLQDLARSGLFTPYTSLFNVTGQPAISIPVGFGADGLPTGVQIVGKPLCEDTLLQLALADGGRAPVGAPAPVSGARTSRTRRGRHAERVGVRRPARAEHLDRQHLRVVPGHRATVGPASASSARSAARRPVSGSGSVRRRRPDAASTSRTNSRWVSVSGPASS